MRKKYWHRKYVKFLEEQLHSNEPYVFVDKIILWIFVLCVVILLPATLGKLQQKNEVVSAKLSSQNVLKIIFFDVTQGDSALITTPNGMNLLIDAGPGHGMVVQESDPGELVTEIDAGKEIILPYLKTHNILLTGIIVTHPHSDHFGGLVSIFNEGFYPKWFMDSGIETSHPVYYKILQEIKKKKIEYKIAKPQQKIFLDEDVEIEILAPVNKYSLEFVDRAVNNSSIVAKLTYKRISVLFTGDIEIFAEMDLLEYKDKLKSTILKIPHHGSFTSTSLPFLDSVSPEVAIISCGRGNPFGHPHSETIEKLNSRKIKIYRTDQNGNITLLTDGEFYNIVVEREY